MASYKVRSGSYAAGPQRRSGGSNGVPPRSSSLATSIKDAITGAPQQPSSPSGLQRPPSRGANVMRRPAPKAITGGSAQRSPADSGGGVRDIPTEKGSRDLKSPASGRKPPGTTVPAGAATTGDAGGVSATPPAIRGPEQSLMDQVQAQGNLNPYCTISTDADASSEIRTKVFRIGAPLLRSTIPVCLGRPTALASPTGCAKGVARREDDSDVESVLSLSDVEMEDRGAINVTLDFPC